MAHEAWVIAGRWRACLAHCSILPLASQGQHMLPAGKNQVYT